MACASRTVSIIRIEATKKHKKHKLRGLCFLCFFVVYSGGVVVDAAVAGFLLLKSVMNARVMSMLSAA